MQCKYGFSYTLRGCGGWLIIQLLNLARSLAILQSIKLFHTCKTVIAEWGAKRVLAVGSSLFLRPSSKIFVAPKWLRILPEIHLCHRFQLQFTTGATWLNFFVHKEHTQHNITHAQNQLFVVLFSNPSAWWPFYILQGVRCSRQCGVAASERVPPAPLGWYIWPEWN